MIPFRLFALPFLAVLCLVALGTSAPEADAGPICKLIRRVTHPLESFRENRAERQAARRPAAPAVQQAPRGAPLPKGPAVAPKSDCPGPNCPIPQKKTSVDSGTYFTGGELWNYSTDEPELFKCRCADCKRADCEALKGTGPCLCAAK